MSLKEQIRERYEKRRYMKREILDAFGKPRNLGQRLYKTRFYANVFGGPILAAVGTVAAIRYAFLPKYISPGWEAASWVFATFMSTPFQLYAIPMGLGFGVISGTQLAKSRARKKRKKLEEKLSLNAETGI